MRGDSPSNSKNMDFSMQQENNSHSSRRKYFVLNHKSAFASFLAILARIIMKTNKQDIYHLLNKLFVSNENWVELVKIFTNGLFVELFEKVFSNNNENEGKNQEDNIINYINNDREYSNEIISLFINCQKVLFYYKSLLIMSKNIIIKEKLDQKQRNVKSEKKKLWKNIIRRILHNMIFLIKPHNGLLSKYIELSSNLNSVIISLKDNENLNKNNQIQFNFYKEIFQLLTMIFSFSSKFSCLNNEEIVSFYIK